MPRRNNRHCSSESSYESESSSDGGHGKRTHQGVDRSYNNGRNKRRSEARPQVGVYVLRNRETGVRYVGKSNNMEARIIQHRNGGDPLVRENTVTVGSAGDLESWERNEVLTRMYEDGIDQVRGWRYTRSGPLPMDDKISARNDIMEKFDLCRRCGHNNHFADRCFARSPAAWCADIPM